MKTLSIFLSLFLLLSCKPEGSSSNSPLKIDEKRAFSFVEKTVSFGSRYPGSQASINFAEWVKAEGEKLGFKSEIQKFKDVFDGGIVEFRNIIITVPAKKETKDFIVVGSHFDNKYLDGIKDWQSANDGPSSCGLLIEILYQIKETPQDWNLDKELRFVFFDGEECRHEYTDFDGLWGSRHYVNELEKKGQIKHCRYMLLVDLIGDKDLNIEFPKNNSEELKKHSHRIAKEHGLSQYFSNKDTAIIDDFIPFEEKNIPVIDFIDFDFGPNNSYWHSKEDTLDKLSPKSLKIVGTVFQQLIWELSSLPNNK